MRSPTIYESSSSLGATKGSKGKMARMCNFLAMSLRSKKYTSTPQSSQYSANISEQLCSLIQEGSSYIGRPLEQHKCTEVPPFLQSLCSHILTVGVDIETLLLEDWSQKHIRAIIFDGMTLNNVLQECPIGVHSESYLATNIFRLYVAQIPQPLVSRNLAIRFFENRKDLLYSSFPVELDADDQAYIFDMLIKELNCLEFRILDYIVSFIRQIMRTSDVSYSTGLATYLGRELCRFDEENHEFCRIGEILIKNYEGIFQRDSLGDDSCSSDSSSRTTDACTPDDRSQDETSSTSDTDDFRSTPVSPLKEFAERSSREVLEFETKQLRKDSSIRSITELLSAHDDTSRDEGVRTSTYQDYSQEESSAISDDSSEESDGARDADGSGTDPEDSCPHEQRRSSERAFPGMHKFSNNSQRPRRKSKRRHSKEDLMTRVQSSEDDEKATSSPDERKQSQGSQLFRDLLSSNEPATVDRASWAYNMVHSENFHRTAPRYSRYDEEEAAKEKKGWFDDCSNSEPHRINHTMKSLTKSISSIKKKIKRLDEDYEFNNSKKLHHGGRNHHGDVKKLNAELNRLRKELKKMKSDASSMISRPFRLEPPQIFKPDTIDTIRHVEETLLYKRNDANRPCELNQMNQDQIQSEKTELQRALLYYESIHGRPTTKEDRDLARPLYDRYRQVKRTIVRTSSRTKENMIELPPIMEHVAMDFTLASPQHRGSLQGEDGIREHQEILLNASINPDPHPELSPTPVRPTVNIGDLHALPIEELKERKKEARDDKRRLRKNLRDFEEKFEMETGRKVQKEDRGAMEHSYSEYKHAKAKLRLLEALISKHESLN